MSKDDKVYSEEEIKERLKKDLPLWIFEGNWIKRKYKTQNWKSTLMVINTVGHLAEAAWHHPDRPCHSRKEAAVHHRCDRNAEAGKASHLCGS